MDIEIAVQINDSGTKKGNLLEKIAGEFLESQGYGISKQLQITGMELDLLCVYKANRSKEIYVECKAYDYDNKIQADVIKALAGARELGHYKEAWLVTTSPLGKEAKGLVDETEKGPDKQLYTFYTPEKLVASLIGSHIIKDASIAKKAVEDIVDDVNRIGKASLLITEYGYFWVVTYLYGGKPQGVVIVYASSGDLVTERELLQNLSELNSSFKNLDFYTIFNFIDNDKLEPKKISIQDIRLNERYLAEINDMGVNITHPDKDCLVLSDLFVYPDLEDIEDEKKNKISSAELLALKDGYKKIIVFGDDVSGKTALATTLQKSINQGNIIAIYLNASEIKKIDFENFVKLLANKFEEQYSNKDYFVKFFNSVVAEDRSRILIIIDDFDAFSIKRHESKASFFQMLCDKFVNIFIFSNRSIEIETIVGSEAKETLREFKLLRIKQFGHVLRDELIDRWLTAENGETISDEDILNKKREISTKIGTAVGNNFVPTYPLYLLTMLQLIETGNKLKIQGSSYAELYRYFINQALASVEAKPEDWDFYHTYLSYFAFHLFSIHQKSISEEEMRSMYNDYAVRMDIANEFEKVHKLLTKAKLLKNENGTCSFSHSYSYYFFIAKYLSDNIEKEEIKTVISDLTKGLHRDQYANIVIFLIHHSKNKSIIDGVIEESKKMFSEITPFMLTEAESSNLNELIHKEVLLSVQDEDPKEFRKRELKAKDDTEREMKDEITDEGAVDIEHKLDLFGKINLSFKLIEILGQITTTYYGSLDSAKKTEMLEMACALGLKALKALLEDIEKYSGTIRQAIADFIKNKGALSELETKRIADRFIYNFSEMVIFSFIKRISDSIASRNIFISVDKIMELNRTPAMELINLGVKLDFPNELNAVRVLKLDSLFSKNQITRRLLRFLVVEHLYKFYVDRPKKQSLCDKLGIKLLLVPRFDSK